MGALGDTSQSPSLDEDKIQEVDFPFKISSSHGAHRALLDLERRNGTITAQLREAALILGIDLAANSGCVKQILPVALPSIPAPKEEWVLRWLLKKLRNDKAYSADPATFVLLQQLIYHIPIKNLATILNDQKFINTLKDIIFSASLRVLEALHRQSSSATGLSGSETSHTLRGSPLDRKVENAGNTDRKRKRDHQGDFGPETIDQNVSLEAAIKVFLNVLGCLKSLTAFCSPTYTSNGAEQFHMERALRTTPSMVADITKICMSVSAQLLSSHVTSDILEAQSLMNVGHTFGLLNSLLDLWDLRIVRFNDTQTISSYQVFSDKCLLSTLRVHHYASMCGKGSQESIYLTQRLDRLIALHTILPARAAFFANGGRGIDYSQEEPDWSAVRPVTETFRKILEMNEQQSFHATLSVEEFTQENRTAVHVLPMVFDIAARSVPRDTFQRQTTETPWLETLFVAIAELAFEFVRDHSSSDGTSLFPKILEEMFRVALRRKIRLSLNTLMAHAKFTGLLKDDWKGVEWRLTALLIQLDVDIFVPNSGLKQSSLMLTSLFEKLVRELLEGKFNDVEVYSYIKNEILIPLLHGLAAARDIDSFTRVWHDQLLEIENHRCSGNKAVKIISLLEDEDLIQAYKEVVRSSLTEARLQGRLQDAVTKLNVDNGTISEAPTAYSYFVILEGESAAWADCSISDVSLNKLQIILEVISKTLASTETMHWRWRLWRFARNVLERVMISGNGALNLLGTHFFDISIGIVSRLHRKFNTKHEHCLELYEAWKFLTTACVGATDQNLTPKVNSALSVFIDLFHINLSDLARRRGSWDGRPDTLISTDSLRVAYQLSIFHTPGLWSRFTSKNRQSLFQQMVLSAAHEYENNGYSTEDWSISEHPFLYMWIKMISPEYLMSIPGIVDDLLSILARHLKDFSTTSRFSVLSLQILPVRLISRHYRGIFLDHLTDITLATGCPASFACDLLSVQTKLARMPKSSAKITANWDAIWKIYQALFNTGADTDIEVITCLRALTKALFTTFARSTDEHRQKSFTRLYNKLVASKPSTQLPLAGSPQGSLFVILVSFLWNHRVELSDIVKTAQIESLRFVAFCTVGQSAKKVRDDIKETGLTAQNIAILGQVVELLEGFEDLIQKDSELLNCVRYFRGWSNGELGLTDINLKRLTSRCDFSKEAETGEAVCRILQYAELASVEAPRGSDLQLFVRDITRDFHAMPEHELLELIRRTRESTRMADYPAHRLLLAGLAVAALKPAEEKRSVLANELSALCTFVTEFLYRGASIEEFCYATECLDILLRSQPRAITQFNIDNLLAGVSITVSGSGPSIPSEFSGTIYTRLCRIVGSIFGLYRQQLGGRFHLVLPVMQRLLACLFTPHSNPNLKLTRARHAKANLPPWMSLLSVSHAVNFTRLLTSLCDPTVSAVSRPAVSGSGSGREGLIDKTKRAKRIAGQYLQYLIMEYANCSLHGSVTPEMKSALLPGLYAVLDVMSRDTMKALNAGLDASGRSVFKSLYDDYIKFGKWKEG